jgi:hypothetical protein
MGEIVRAVIPGSRLFNAVCSQARAKTNIAGRWGTIQSGSPPAPAALLGRSASHLSPLTFHLPSPAPTHSVEVVPFSPASGPRRL